MGFFFSPFIQTDNYRGVVWLERRHSGAKQPSAVSFGRASRQPAHTPRTVKYRTPFRDNASARRDDRACRHTREIRKKKKKYIVKLFSKNNFKKYRTRSKSFSRHPFGSWSYYIGRHCRWWQFSRDMMSVSW